MGRPKIANDQIIYFIAVHTIYTPEISGRELSKKIREAFQVDMCYVTVNTIRANYAFKYGRMVRSLDLSPQSRQKRYDFSLYHTTQQTDPRHIIFSDEKMFRAFTFHHQVWKVEGEIYPAICKIDKQHPPQVMVWGAIGYNYKSRLVFFEGTVNSETFSEKVIFGSGFYSDADCVFGLNRWILMQDNARPHVSAETLQNFEGLEIKLLEQWPPYSPDLNPIEVTWAILSMRVESSKPNNHKELKNAIQNEWDNLEMATINALIDSWPNRLRKCVKKRGGQVRNY